MQRFKEEAHMIHSRLTDKTWIDLSMHKRMTAFPPMDIQHLPTQNMQTETTDVGKMHMFLFEATV